MEMTRMHSGRLRAVGYEPRARLLRVELDDGTVLDYTGVGDEVWRRLVSSGSPWSYYRDNIEEEFSASRSRRAPDPVKANPLDDLFRK